MKKSYVSEFRESVFFFKKETVSDGAGGQTTASVFSFMKFASVTQVSQERTLEGYLESEEMYRIKVRADGRIKPTMTILWRGLTMQIHKVQKAKVQGLYDTLFAKA